MERESEEKARVQAQTSEHVHRKYDGVIQLAAIYIYIYNTLRNNKTIYTSNKHARPNIAPERVHRQHQVVVQPAEIIYIYIYIYI